MSLSYRIEEIFNKCKHSVLEDLSDPVVDIANLQAIGENCTVKSVFFFSNVIIVYSNKRFLTIQLSSGLYTCKIDMKNL